ncbi:hypothetical protein DH2020_005383 [Rehmannia glutinosa]|uniref:Uncharacterized protein n=1 Tax=Rehmannia glutinosa TaxID=99300 RepID=A0ABR0XFW1_REHGL
MSPILFLVSTILTFIFHQALANSTLETYIVHLSLPEDRFFEQSENLESWYHSFLPDRDPSRVVHTYRHVINGFAAKLTPRELEEMEKQDGFLYARPSKKYDLHTTHSPTFLGLNQNQGVWPGPANFGKGVIIGLLDSGITPGHASFDDKGVPPPPAKWKGKCEFNKEACNNKLIGARIFGDDDRGTTLDHVGHGTHTASTAAGNFVLGANLFGQANGTASGLAPLAHLAMYKIYFSDSAILAGIDAAIDDGVDVLSMSFGEKTSTPFYKNSIAIGSFAAMKKGIFVSCSAGNGGPKSHSLVNEAPWILTVGASTTDRKIVGIAKLGNQDEIEGETLNAHPNFLATPLPLVTADNLDIKGKIVLNEITEPDRIGIRQTSIQVDAAAFILMNNEKLGYTVKLSPDLSAPPTLHVSNFSGEKIKAYINSTSNPVATISFKGTIVGDKTAPAVAAFSSRGPNLASPGILKPDIIGPGVNIIAAWPEPVEDGNPAFNIISGTSMSCPHLSGVAVLIKSAHPDWSPAMIKSAIMTTATQINLNQDPILDQRHLPADIFAIGAGHVNPSMAMDPGLVYDIPSRDYISYLCSLYDEKQVAVIVRENINCNGSEYQGIPEAQLNYPSFAVALGDTSLTYSKTVTNVGDAKSTYNVQIENVPGVNMVVEPTVLAFTELNQKMSYKVNFSRQDFTTDGSEYVQGSIAWVSANHKVRIPVSVKMMNN